VKAAHPDQPLEWWFQDEARIGQQGTLTNIWAQTGSRPRRVRQTEYDWVYVYAAVNAVTGASSALLAPNVNTDYMNAHLQFISAQVAAGNHGILVLDQAGWHVAKALKAPANLTLLHLPPLLAGTEPGGAGVGVHAEPLLEQLAVRRLRRIVRRHSGGLEPAGPRPTQIHLPHGVDRARDLNGKRINTESWLSARTEGTRTGSAL
jgi:hypothetical protein